MVDSQLEQVYKKPQNIFCLQDTINQRPKTKKERPICLDYTTQTYKNEIQIE